MDDVVRASVCPGLPGTAWSVSVVRSRLLTVSLFTVKGVPIRTMATLNVQIANNWVCFGC